MPDARRMDAWTVRLSAKVRRPAPRRAAARRLAEMFGLGEGAWETLYDDLELIFRPGEIVTVIGPSGCGKSVLLREVLARVPDAVPLWTGGLAHSDNPPICLAQPASQAGWMEVLSRCGLAEAPVLMTPARHLSAGQLYRLALARAFWEARRRGRPALIVADEFASNLDDDTAGVVAAAVRKWVSAQPVALLAATVRSSLLPRLRPDKVVVKPLAKPGWITVPHWPRRRNAGAAAVMRWPVRTGSIQDYKQLAAFHYLTGPPAAHKRVYVIRRPRGRGRQSWASAAGPDIAAVLVVSPPLIGVHGRDVATGGRYNPDAFATMSSSPPRRGGMEDSSGAPRGREQQIRIPKSETNDNEANEKQTAHPAAVPRVSGTPSPGTVSSPPRRGGMVPPPPSDARHQAIERLNAEVECISRVIVHPTYRSCGLAVRLVRHALATSPAPIVEALAAMGRVHPFFELAGMTSWFVAGRGKYVYYDHVDATRPLRNRPHARPPVAGRPRRPRGNTARKPARTEGKNLIRRVRSMSTHDDWMARPPADRTELAALVREKFGLVLGERSLCPHHHTPLDYLAASFFDQDDLLVWANRGGGKTMLAAAATVLDAVFRRPAKIRVLGGSFDQSDRLAEYIREMLSAHPQLLAGSFTRRRVRLVGGSEIRMLAQSQRAVRGQHVQKIRCDEVDLFDAEVWRAVQFATRSSQAARGSIEVLSTLHRPGGLMQELVSSARRGPTPGSGYRLLHWCLWEVIERCPPQRRCADCLLVDDCKGIARRGRGFFRVDDAIAIKARSSRAAWEAEMLCRGASRQYLVFDEFDLGRHVVAAAYEPGWPMYRAIDFGYRSPLVCLWIQLSPAGNVHVLDEYVRSRLPLTRHAEEIRRRDPGPVLATYVDPAGRAREATSGAACTELLAAAGIPCACRASAITEGLELIRAALAPAAGDPSLTIHPRCTKLIEAFQSYHYPPPGARGDADAPVKDGPDHVIDALRYFFVNRARPRIAIARGRY